MNQELTPPFLHKQYDYRNRESLTPEKKDEELFAEFFPQLLAAATVARDDDAISYRNFKVGCSVLAIDAQGQTHVFSAGNKKELKNDAKYCAERGAIEQATAAGYTRIVGLITVSKETSTVRDNETAVEHPAEVLHPCTVCRNLLHLDPLVDGQTILVMHNDSKENDPKEERTTVGKLLQSYAKRDHETFNTSDTRYASQDTPR